MKRNITILVSLLAMIVIFAGCSSKIEDELITVQTDMKENVADSMTDVADDFEQKGMEVENGDISPEEFIDFYEAEVQPIIEEKRQYLSDYEAPSTDEAKEYYTVLTDGMNLALDVIEDSADLMVGLLDDSMSEEEFFELGEELESVVEELDKKDEEITKMQSDLEDEYNIEFEEIELE